MNYKKKYLKCKAEYLNLKNNKIQIGGNDECYDTALQLQDMVKNGRCGSRTLDTINILRDTISRLEKYQIPAATPVVTAAPSATIPTRASRPDILYLLRHKVVIAVTSDAYTWVKSGKLNLESIRKELEELTKTQVSIWIGSSKDTIAENTIEPPKSGEFLIILDRVYNAPRLGIDARPSQAFPNEVDAFLRQGNEDWGRVAGQFGNNVIWLFVYDPNEITDLRINLALSEAETPNLHSGTKVGTRRYERYIKGVSINDVDNAIESVGNKIKEVI